MQRFRPAPLTLLVLIVIGLALPVTGWLSPRSAASSGAGLRAADGGDLAGEAAARHRRGEPRHWRALLLHH